MGKEVQYSSEVRERVVLLFQQHVHEHSIELVSDAIDRRQDRLHDADAAHMGGDAKEGCFQLLSVPYLSHRRANCAQRAVMDPYRQRVVGDSTIRSRHLGARP